MMRILLIGISGVLNVSIAWVAILEPAARAAGFLR